MNIEPSVSPLKPPKNGLSAESVPAAASSTPSDPSPQSFCIHLSGLPQSEKDELKSMVSSLKGQIDDNFRFTTKILILDSVDSQKYELAKYTQKVVLTPQWIHESFKAKQWLGTEKFELKIFEGVKIGIIGFKKEEFEELKMFVEKEKGRVTNDVDEVFTVDSSHSEKPISSSVKIIVLNETSKKQYLTHIQASKIPIVDKEWLRECFLENRYLQPHRFLHFPAQFERKIKDAEAKMNQFASPQSLDRLMNRIEPSDKVLRYLSNCVFYLYDLDKKEEAIQKKLIHIGGGAVLKVLIPNTTHIVTSSYTNEDLIRFNKHKKVKVMSPFWLKKCLTLKTKIPECEFLLKPSVPQRSQSTTLNFLPGQPSLQKDRKSYNSQTSGTPKSNIPQFESTIFRKTLFFIQESLQKEMKPVIREILVNSGKVVVKPSFFEDQSSKNFTKIFVLLPDGFSKELKEQCKSVIGGDKKIVFVSPRWVSYCKQRGEVIEDLVHKCLIHLMPMNHPIPYKNFKGVKIMIGSEIGIPKNYFLQECVELLGAQTVKSESENPHFILHQTIPLELGEDIPEQHKDLTWLLTTIVMGFDGELPPNQPLEPINAKEGSLPTDNN